MVLRIILRCRIGRPVTHPKTLLTCAGAKTKMRQALGIALMGPSRRVLLHPGRINNKCQKSPSSQIRSAF